MTIADEDKLQFYLEEIYDSNRFDKQEMLTWEREPSATKTDFDLAKTHFETIVNATNTYKQNAGGGTAGRNRYESANQMADYGDEIREYIQQLAAMRAELSAASSLSDERPHHEIASPNLFDAARARIQATSELLAGPLDAILADIEREDIEEGARTTPLIGAPSLPSLVDGKRERQREATALCQRLRLLSKSIAKRQRSAGLAAQ